MKILKYLLFAFFALFLIGCTTTKPIYIPKEVVRYKERIITDTVIKVKYKEDTTRQQLKDTASTIESKRAKSIAIYSPSKDSITHTLIDKAIDTLIIIEKVKEYIHDSIEIPIITEIETIKEVPRKWNIKEYLSIIGMLLIGLYIGKKLF